ncbi:MAG TPA: NYN domain-containing protein [Candidatus Paceibacterota bacterium]
MQKTARNYTFIDGQNLHLGIQSLGWKLDYKKFRVYLKEKYAVEKAYVFIGYLSGNQPLYTFLQDAGYILVFKPVMYSKEGDIKGNVDADLVLYSMIEYENYGQAIIVTSDGDFYSLVRHLYKNQKLKAVMSPYVKTCSTLLKDAAREKIVFMDNLQQKLAYLKRKSTA